LCGGLACSETSFFSFFFVAILEKIADTMIMMTTTQTEETAMRIQNGDIIYLGRAGGADLVATVANDKVTMAHGDQITAELELASLPADVEAAIVRAKAKNARDQANRYSMCPSGGVR
jgi:hypothetical protein